MKTLAEAGIIKNNGKSLELTRPLPTNPQGELVSFEVRAEAFSGPLPPPAMLSDYNNLVPRGAERILAMAEKQQDHRHEIEKRVIGGNVSAQVRGQYFAFFLALLIIVGAIYLIALGMPIWGFSTLIATIGGLAFVFITGRKKDDEERDRKRASLPPGLQ